MKCLAGCENDTELKQAHFVTKQLTRVNFELIKFQQNNFLIWFEFCCRLYWLALFLLVCACVNVELNKLVGRSTNTDNILNHSNAEVHRFFVNCTFYGIKI